MSVPLQITFRGMDPSDALSNRIREHADKLDQFFQGITGCHVVVDEPHRHHQRHGNRFHVRVELSVPGKDLVIDRPQADLDPTHEDPYVAVRDAFDATRRQLQDYAHRLHAHR